MTTPSIMPLGDSLTAPYVPTLAKLLSDAKVPFRLIGTQGSGALHHEGHGGYRVQQIADKLEGYIAKVGTPDYVALCLGTNDLVGFPFPDVPKILDQWRSLVGALRARGVRLVVCTIPPTTITPSPGIAAFNDGVRAYVKVNAARMGLADLATQIPESELSADGVHLSPAGASHMGRLIARAFSNKVPTHATGKTTGPIDELKRRRTNAIGAIIVVGAALYLMH